MTLKVGYLSDSWASCLVLSLAIGLNVIKSPNCFVRKQRRNTIDLTSSRPKYFFAIMFYNILRQTSSYRKSIVVEKNCK